MAAESSVVKTFVDCLQVKPNTAQKWSKVEGKSHIHCHLGRKRCEYYLPLDDEFVEKFLMSMIHKKVVTTVFGSCGISLPKKWLTTG
eukprot:3123285-Ditylum_brightwellii.AAC.1